jgi:hypothetical protein
MSLQQFDELCQVSSILRLPLAFQASFQQGYGIFIGQAREWEAVAAELDGNGRIPGSHNAHRIRRQRPQEEEQDLAVPHVIENHQQAARGSLLQPLRDLLRP